MKVLKWHNTDSQELFDYHFKRFPKLFQYWADNPIEYSINSQGFRSYFEFEPDKTRKYDIFLGCSHTFGSSHPWENTWPYIVSQNTGNEIVNLGVGGTGPHTSFKNLLTFIDKFKPRNIFHYQPLYPRYDFIDFKNDSFKNYYRFDLKPFQPQYDGDESDYSPYSHQYIQNVMVSDRFLYYNQMKNVFACQGLANSRGIPYYYIEHYPQSGYSPKDDLYHGEVLRDSNNRIQLGITKSTIDKLPEGEILARDGTHYTKSQLESIGNEFIHLKKQYPNGYIEKTPYMEKIFPKKFPVDRWKPGEKFLY